MFTIGIFSTHIPYIAFVVFYAYFFVTGVNKAVAGEISNGEDFYKTEIYASDTFINAEIDTYHYFCEISKISKYQKFKDLLFKRKTNYPEYSETKIRTDFYSAFLFNRPPPSV